MLTSGNHIWAQKEIIPYLDGPMPLLRPLNYPPGVPGRGNITIGKVMVVSLIGRVFIDNYDWIGEKKELEQEHAFPRKLMKYIKDNHLERYLVDNLKQVMNLDNEKESNEAGP